MRWSIHWLVQACTRAKATHATQHSDRLLQRPDCNTTPSRGRLDQSSDAPSVLCRPCSSPHDHEHDDDSPQQHVRRIWREALPKHRRDLACHDLDRRVQRLAHELYIAGLDEVACSHQHKSSKLVANMGLEARNWLHACAPSVLVALSSSHAAWVHCARGGRDW
jgi:hypothetical protein